MKINLIVHSPVGVFVGWIERDKKDVQCFMAELKDWTRGKTSLNFQLATGAASIHITAGIVAQSVIEMSVEDV